MSLTDAKNSFENEPVEYGAVEESDQDKKKILMT